MKKHITRKEALSACVESYIKNNAEEWVLFQEQVKKRRAALADSKFGVAKDDVKNWERGNTLDAMRVTLTLPNKLAQTINLILSHHDDQPPFPMDDAEEAWFVKKYPNFLIPDYY